MEKEKRKPLFKELKYLFLFANAVTENEALPHKTAQSKQMSRQIEWDSTKWTYHKEQSFVIILFS